MYLLIPSMATAAQGQRGDFTLLENLDLMEPTTTEALLGYQKAGQSSRISLELGPKLF